MIHFTLTGKNVDKQKASWCQAKPLSAQDTETVGTLSPFPPHHLYLSLHLNHSSITGIQMVHGKKLSFILLRIQESMECSLESFPSEELIFKSSGI